MRWSYRLFWIVAVLGFWACPASARAGQVLVSNLDQPPSSFSPSIIDPADFWAQQFTTGVSASLVSIKANLGELDAGINGDFIVTAQLFQVTTTSNTPDQGSLVASFTEVGNIPTGMGNFANVEFDPTSTVSLDKSKFYWFVLSGSSSDGSGAFSWQFTDSTIHSGAPGSSLPNFAFFDGSLSSWTIGPDSPFLIEVQGSVPEPSSLILGCVGLSAVVFAARRRMRVR
jgi:PEP-CTERM motif